MEYIELGAEVQEKKFQNKVTGLYTKDFFFETAFMIAVIEVDDFKGLEEEYGRKIAYEVLRLTAEITEKNFRTSDIVADMEDDQIGVIFYNTSNVNAKIALEGLRKKVETTKYNLREDEINFTVSIGATVMHNLMSARTIEKLYAQAKIGLESARRKENNYVVVD